MYSMETVSWPGNTWIKIFLTKITYLFWILLCYPLNTSSFCIGSTSCCSLTMLVFSCSAFLWYPIVPLVFWCSVSVPPLFWYSAAVPCFGVSGFIVCRWTYKCKKYLTHFPLRFSFYTPWKHQVTSFLILSGGTK